MYILAIIAVLVTAAWFVWPILDSIPRGLQTLVKMGTFLVWLLLIVMLNGIFAAPFDVSADAYSVDYHFASEDYALDFATLNHDAEWVKVNGETIALHSGIDDEPSGEPEPTKAQYLKS